MGLMRSCSVLRVSRIAFSSTLERTVGKERRVSCVEICFIKNRIEHGGIDENGSATINLTHR